jgi:hypothetical protein
MSVSFHWLKYHRLQQVRCGEIPVAEKITCFDTEGLSLSRSHNTFRRRSIFSSMTQSSDALRVHTFNDGSRSSGNSSVTFSRSSRHDLTNGSEQSSECLFTKRGYPKLGALAACGSDGGSSRCTVEKSEFWKRGVQQQGLRREECVYLPPK